MALIELIDFKKIRKALWYLLCIIISISLQNLLCARVAIFGVHAFFIPVVIIAFGVFEGAVWGASLGLVAGYFCDITMLESTVLFMVLFAAMGFAAGFLSEFIINRRFFSYFVLAVLGLILTVICQIIPFWIFKGTSLWKILPTMILQTLWSAVFTVPAYFAVKAISIKRKEEEDE